MTSVRYGIIAALVICLMLAAPLARAQEADETIEDPIVNIEDEITEAPIVSEEDEDIEAPIVGEEGEVTEPSLIEEEDADETTKAPVKRPDDRGYALLYYGLARIDDLYGEEWEGESLNLSYSYYQRYYGFSLGMHFLDARTDTRRLEGHYSHHGLELLLHLTPGKYMIQPYAAVGLGAHYNSIDVSGKKDFTRDGFGVRAIGEVGLRVRGVDMTMFGRPANLVLGVYGRKAANREYFFEDSLRSHNASFRTTQYGLQFGLFIEL